MDKMLIGILIGLVVLFGAAAATAAVSTASVPAQPARVRPSHSGAKNLNNALGGLELAALIAIAQIWARKRAQPQPELASLDSIADEPTLIGVRLGVLPSECGSRALCDTMQFQIA